MSGTGLTGNLRTPLKRLSPGKLTFNGTTGLSGASYSSLVLAATPVAFWKLDEASGTSAADATGNGHTGTYNSVTLAQAGPQGNAASFDGSSSYVQVSTITVTSWSVEALVNVTDVSNYRMMLTQNGDNGVEVRADITTGNLVAFSGGVSNTGTAITNAAWTHVAATFDSVSAGGVVYINGSSVGTKPGMTNPTISGSLFLGKRSDGFFFKGLMQGVALYNYALSGATVSAHAAASGHA